MNQQGGEDFAQASQAVGGGNAQIEHQQGQDDGEHPVAEQLEPVLGHPLRPRRALRGACQMARLAATARLGLGEVNEACAAASWRSP